MQTQQQELDKANNLWINPEEAAEIIKRNEMQNYVYWPIRKFLYVSGVHLLSNPLFQNKGRYPGQRGDCGIYWTTSRGRVLAVASINIDTKEDTIVVNQIQGTPLDYLATGHQKRALRVLPWEASLIDVAEQFGKSCGLGKAKIISAERLLAERNAEGIKSSPDLRTMVMRHDISAVYRNFEPDKDGFYTKPLR